MLSCLAETPERTKDKGARRVPGAGRTPSLWHRALWVGPQRRRRRWKRGGTRRKRKGTGEGGVDYKDAKCESCELSFIWGKMKTAAWETAPPIALRDCSKEAVGEGQNIRFW